MPRKETRVQAVHLYGWLCMGLLCIGLLCVCVPCVCACVITLCALISWLRCSSCASLFARSVGQASLIANQLPLTLLIPFAHSVEGYYDFVPSENVCYREKEARQTTQSSRVNITRSVSLSVRIKI